MKRLVFRLILLLCALLSAPAQTTELTLAELMKSLSGVSAISAHFRETKELAMLQEPLYASGILRYRAPDYVKKQTLLPQSESLEIQGDEVLIDHPEKGRHQLSLDDYPAIRAFVESFRATLAGDTTTLERYYRVLLTGDAAAWRLHLEPRESEMAEIIEAIFIQGEGDRILTIETQETNGDRSVMTITPINE